MRLNISREAYDDALAEIETLQKEKAKQVGWPDELFNFVTQAWGDPRGRARGRLSMEDIAAFLNKKGWWQGSGTALTQAFRKERARRAQE